MIRIGSTLGFELGTEVWAIAEVLHTIVRARSFRSDFIMNPLNELLIKLQCITEGLRLIHPMLANGACTYIGKAVIVPRIS
jgi:hypothetical protein